MSELTHYLAQVYRRDILGESVRVGMPKVSAADIRAELAKSDEFARYMGANLPNRDFGLYQRRRALLHLLGQIMEAEKAAGDAPDGEGQ